MNETRLNDKEDTNWQDRIKQVMELTGRTEDEVVMALHDSDGDLNRTVNDLLEGVSPEWEIKRKKARQPGNSKPSCDQSIKLECFNDKDNKRCIKSDALHRIRGRVVNENRGWIRKENKENEKNNYPKTDTSSVGTIKNLNSFYGKSGRGGRGGGRSLGSKGFANRVDITFNSEAQPFYRPIETWTGKEEQQASSETIEPDAWIQLDINEDWENEEYTGSLADSKVFTPSIFIGNVMTKADQNTEQAVNKSELIIASSSHAKNPQKQIRHKPRIPPPSKIPSTAVEMPEDTSSISFLDVQFGALEFGNEKDITDIMVHDKYNQASLKMNILNADLTSTLSTDVRSLCSLNLESSQNPSSRISNVSSKMLNSDLLSSQSSPCIKSQENIISNNTSSYSSENGKEDSLIQTSLSSSSSFTSSNYQPSKSSFSTPTTHFSQYVSNNQSDQKKFTGISSSSTINFSTDNSSSQVIYSSTYTQPSMTTFTPTSSAVSISSSIYNSSTITAQSQTTYAESTVHPSYICTGYQSQSSTSTLQTSSTVSYVSSMQQESNVYTNTTQSVYSNSYPGYSSQSQSLSQDCNLSDNKDLNFENSVSTKNSGSCTTVCALVNSSSVHSSPPKSTLTNVVSKNAASLLICNSSSNNTVSSSGSLANSNITPILSHQYIMGQSVPYATYQQPHMYSYEDIQLMQQRISHMPASGYYDTSLGYQSTAPVTTLGNSRNENIPGVQNVQGVQTVQGQFSSDARFTRSDNNTSPVSSSISQQTATQHQQQLINPIPPGYAYFYGGGLMPAGGFQYGTPAIYPQIATAANAGTTNSAYGSKASSYGAGYSSTNYDNLNSTSSSGDYKSGSGYSNSQSNKISSSNGSLNASGTPNATDINSTIYSKSHVALSKSYEKQTFHSATPPPFGLTNSQNANVISGYGAAHLFIPTVPHQLHQPIHQENNNSSGQRTNLNTQSKAQVKPGYSSTSYWTGSN